jgi:hypothetical protein
MSTLTRQRDDLGHLTPAERIKLDLLSEGLAITPEAQAYIDRANGDRPMTPADYASTSGIILVLDEDVWVNAPIVDYNANFVVAPANRLVGDQHGLAVEGPDGTVRARFWLPPAYHDQLNDHGEPYNSYAFTHGDRVRISPIEGCSFTCTFCNLPYEFRYRRKRVEGLVDSVARAIADETQPASHVLISGGTPRPEDYEYVKDVYEAVITGFPDIAVDIMMVPLDELMNVAWLNRIGVNELSLNIEIYNRDIARRKMAKKHKQTLEYYLDFIESAAEELGPGRVRSMLLVGIEPLEDTLAGVDAIAARGGIPVLSPFRPDPETPMRDHEPPPAPLLAEAYLRAQEVAARHDVTLGPSCLVCMHNTLTLPGDAAGVGGGSFGSPHVV